jgi:NRAMP (natural resistance-associated macrophage protein)-like metal ion transporter
MARGDDGGGPLRKVAKLLGPGLITGAADDDPSGITTYSQAGAAFQYGLLWTALLQIPLMIGVQYTCAKVGLVSGRDLGRVLRDHYPIWVLWCATTLLVVANTVTAAADLAGVASGAQLLTGAPAVLVAPLAGALLLGVLVFGSYGLLANVLKWLTVSLLAYVVSGVLAGPSWSEVLKRTFVPGIRPTFEYLVTFVGVFGTTISPYLFIWQSGEEVDEAKERGKRSSARWRGASAGELREARADTVIGMTVSQLITYFIIVAAGATLYPSGHRNIGTPLEAAQALRPIGGGVGTALFSVGLIGTGLLAIPTLAGASAFAIAALGRWRSGMSESARQAKAFYGVVAAGVLAATGLALTRVSPVVLLFGAAVMNGILAPPLLVLVLLVANNPEVMGERRNGRALNALTGLSALIMGVAALWLAAWWIAARR